MTASTLNFTTIKGAITALQLGAIDMALFLAVGDSLALPTQYAVQSGGLAGDLAPLPGGFLPVGIIEKKSGAALQNTITTTPTGGYGYQESTRLIRKSRDVTVDATLLQTQMLTLGAYWGVDFTGTAASTTTGEVNLPIPESALDIEYRGIMIGKDGPVGKEVYTIYDGPRFVVSKTGKIQWNDDMVQSYPVTFTLLFDSDYNYAVRPSFCGLGWFNGLAALAGFMPASAVQTITLTGTPTGGTFTVSFDGQTTAPIAYNAAASAVQTALQALSTIGAGNIAVTGSAGAYTATFQGALANMPVTLMTGSAASLTGGTSAAVVIAQTTAGEY